MGDDAVQRYFGDGAGGKQVHAKRRGDHAQGQVDHHDHAEVHRVITQVGDQRPHDRHHDDQGRYRLQEGAEQEEEDDQDISAEVAVTQL